MIKTLGQTGLNFIANKFKELKDLLDNKIDEDKVGEVIIRDTKKKIPRSLEAWITSLKYLSEFCAKSLGSKVDKVEGKGLSTNDYTNDDKDKLTNIEDGANKVTKISQLENDRNLKTEAEISQMIQSSAGGGEIKSYQMTEENIDYNFVKLGRVCIVSFSARGLPERRGGYYFNKFPSDFFPDFSKTSKYVGMSGGLKYNKDGHFSQEGNVAVICKTNPNDSFADMYFSLFEMSSGYNNPITMQGDGSVVYFCK